MLAVLSALAGVVLGSLGTYLIETRLTRRSEAVSARLELAPIRSLIWQPNTGQSLGEQLTRIRARATLLGVDRALLSELADAANACWRESLEMSERDPDEGGISHDNLGRLDQAIEVVDEAIVRATSGIRWRRWLEESPS